jgi:hypothetical protein
MTTTAVLKEISQQLDPFSPRKRRFTSDAAELTIFYSFPDGDRVTGMELFLSEIPVGKTAARDVYISSDDYYKKFVVVPAEKTSRGFVRGATAGHMHVDKAAVLERVRLCTAELENNVIDFVTSRIRKFMY